MHNLNNLLDLKLVDMRMIHIEAALSYWSQEKCTTMSNITMWQKAIKRRGGYLKVLLDTDR